MLSRPLVAVGAVAVLAAIGAWGRRRQQVLQRSRSRGHLLALREALKLRQALQHKLGLDIGGTLAKIVLASEPKDTPEYSPTRYTLPNPRSVTHDKLGFTARSGGFSFAFISTPTETLEETARSIAETVQYPADDEYREIIATGGGAHRFYDTFRDVLQVELQPLKELHAAVDGLLFLAAEGPTEELFTVEAGKERSVDWPEPLFPFLLVNMGSGVSVVRVDGENNFTRVGGTACGGATFLGLARALTGLRDFHEMLELAARGDNNNVDKTVGDIYGNGGCVDLGMPPAWTAASFGKLAATAAAAPQSEDLVRSLLRMVVQASVVLAKAYASNAGCMSRIIFAGGFLQDNGLARREIAESMALVGGRALFCRHSEFLGALGSLGACVHHHNKQQSAGAEGAAARQQQQHGGPPSPMRGWAAVRQSLPSMALPSSMSVGGGASSRANGGSQSSGGRGERLDRLSQSSPALKCVEQSSSQR